MRIYAMVAFVLLSSAGISLGIPVEVIVDNLDLGFNADGVDWVESGMVDEYDDSSLYTNDIGDKATWTPDLSEAGWYDVCVWYASMYDGGGYADRDSAASYSVYHKNGSTTVDVDQDVNSGQWFCIGQYEFDAGAGGYVELIRTDDNGDATSADAVKLTLLPEPTSLVLLAMGGLALIRRRK